VELIHAYRARGILVKQGFGQTETSILCCLDDADAIRKAGSVGRAVFHAELRLVDDALADVPDGTVGEIAVRGPIAMLGYWQKPDARAGVCGGGGLPAGDRARGDGGGFTAVGGRGRELYIGGGETVSPARGGGVSPPPPAIADVAVAGVAD